MRKIKINSRAFVKIYKIFESCNTPDQMASFSRWIRRLHTSGILKDTDLLYFSGKIQLYAKGYDHGLLDREALEE